VLVDIPGNVKALKEGADSTARVVRGKTAPATVGTHCANMFTMAFAGNARGVDGREVARTACGL
jgi:hypothetical protein